VHECGHGLDLGLGFISESNYVVTDDLTITCPAIETLGRGGIMGDAFESAVPDDSYESPYLTTLGDQGFEMLLEEAYQYVNSLASAYAFSDQYENSQSERDGILTFLWYVERYLHQARTTDEATYNALVQSECWRTAILTLWGRAWIYVELTKDMGQLGINDEEILAAATNTELLHEIDLIREAHGCESPD
jgi:hypothetical protein